jgi:enoyl-CoA hydratase/carnithine racemase
MPHEDILYDVDDGVATLTFNRPEVMNALRPQTSLEVFEVLDEVRNDDAVRCLLITGNGRGFCAGDDFHAIFLDEDRAARKIDRQVRRIKHGEASLDEIFGLEKPTIAAVNGPAVGYGMDIALYCDIRIASERAKLGWFFVRRGVVGTVGGTFILRQLVGLSKAFELTLTGDLVDAEEALCIGLVSRVVPAESLMEEAQTLAHKIASGPPLAQRAIKEMATRGRDLPWAESVRFGETMRKVAGATEDAREGIQAAADRRPPVWKGR